MYMTIAFKYKKQAKRYLLDTYVSCAFVLLNSCLTRATLVGQSTTVDYVILMIPYTS